MEKISFSDTQKQAIVSLLVEMINADECVANGEVTVFNTICAELGITAEIFKVGYALNRDVAINIMKSMSDLQKIYTAKLLTRVIDADAKDDDREIQLLNAICQQTGLNILLDLDLGQ